MKKREKTIDLSARIIQLEEEVNQIRRNLVSEKLYHTNLRKDNKQLRINNQILFDETDRLDGLLKMKDRVNKKLYKENIKLRKKLQKEKQKRKGN